jgi:hypothetical protein
MPNWNAKLLEDIRGEWHRQTGITISYAACQKILNWCRQWGWVPPVAISYVGRKGRNPWLLLQFFATPDPTGMRPPCPWEDDMEVSFEDWEAQVVGAAPSEMVQGLVERMGK